MIPDLPLDRHRLALLCHVTWRRKPNVWPLAPGPEKANDNKVCLGCGYSYIDRFHSKKEKGKKNCTQLDCHCGKPKEGHPAFMPPGPYCTGDCGLSAHGAMNPLISTHLT